LRCAQADGSIDAVYTPDKKKPRKKPDGGDPVAVSRAFAFPSCTQPVVTEIRLCHARSCYAIEDGNAPAGRQG
jgi:hypothetical protein